jgi:hypothetical protein
VADIRKAQNNFTSGVITSSVLGRNDIQKYASGCKRIENCIVKAHGGISNRPGTYYVDSINGPGRFFEFSYSVEQNYALLFFEKKMRIYTNGAVIVYPDGHAQAGQIVEIVTPYAYADLAKLRFIQSADVLFLAHPSHPPTTLTRTSHHEWAFEAMAFDPLIVAPTIPTLVKAGFGAGTKDMEYKISAVSEIDEESYPSPVASIQIDSTWPEGATVTITWTAVLNAARYNIYKSARGFFGWIGTVEATDTLKFIDDYIEENSKDGPKIPNNPFAENNHPGVVGIYQQRLMFARSNAKPQTIWGSCTGKLNNFSKSYPLKSDDSIEAIADSAKMNEIRHFLPFKKNMLTMTSGAEIMMNAGRNADGITPTGNLHFDIQSYHGSSDVPPLVAGNNMLTVQNSGRIVRDLYYTMAEDGYVGTELSILASDLLESPIVDWTYQNEPYHIAYACREDGKLLGLTYMREQEVYAWSSMSTLGEYMSSASIRNGRDDDVYFLVKRDNEYFIEYQKLAKPGEERSDSFFVDCGLTYDGEPIDTVTAPHLADKQVAILADGSAIMDKIADENGTVVLDRGYSKIHMGLPYESLGETLDPEISDDKGSLKGKTKRVSRVIFQVDKSATFEAGWDEDNMVMIKSMPPENWGEAPALTSGYFEAGLLNKHREEANIVFRQTLPLPMNILSVITEIEVGTK